MSPILALQNEIAAAAFSIAPERAAALRAFTDAHDVCVEATYDFQNVVWVNSNKTIGFNVAALEALWASTHLAWVVYQEILGAQDSGRTQYEFGSTDRCGKALEVHNLVWQNWRQRLCTVWPAHLPSPADAAVAESDSAVTNEIFLCAIAWTFHHELAHIRHSDLIYGTATRLDPESMRRENDADSSATEWILANSDESNRFKRSLGILMALIWFALIELEYPQPLVTHPPVSERLDRFFRQIGDHQRHRLSAFFVAVSQVVLAQLGSPLDPNESDVEAAFSAALTQLESRRRQQSDL